MVSADSKFDQWRRGEVELTDSEYNGYQMFLREGGDPEVVPGGQFGADCFHCHGEAGLQFTDHLFHNNGLDPSFESDPGHVMVSGNPLDSGKFRTPTLRNVALSGPYMHDGRFETLEDVVEHYNRRRCVVDHRSVHEVLHRRTVAAPSKRRTSLRSFAHPHRHRVHCQQPSISRIPTDVTFDCPRPYARTC